MRLILLMAVAFTVAACSPLGRSAAVSNDQEENTTASAMDQSEHDMRDLSDQLRRISGVTVQGSGANARVFIRGGVNNLSGAQEPLFVVNGTPMQGGYSQIYNAVPVQEIKNIRVLKGSETAIYGSRGGHGVIEIKTK